MGKPIAPEVLLAELDELVRTIPSLSDPGPLQAWAGRGAALLVRWNPVRGGLFQAAVPSVLSSQMSTSYSARGFMVSIIEEARADLRLDIGGTISAVIATGNVFEYFDEIRKVIETATQDVFFVDPYLDADFVPRYLPHIQSTAKIRLLTEKKLPALLPAVDLFAQQHDRAIAVRAATGMHDRLVFVDGTECYISGASFKDGAKKAPVTLTQIKDGLPAILSVYETMWSGAKVERA